MDEAAIKAARQAYDALTAEAKALVTNEERLKAAEEALALLTKVYNYGDLNGDEKITADDALLALQAAVGKITLNEEQTVIANVDGEGEVTATDALLILQRSVDKIDKFPVENDK